MAHEHSPSSVMYADFKDFGLKNNEVALALLDNDRSFGGVAMHERIASRTQMSRTIVHVAPGGVDGYLFNDFAQSSQTILSRLVSLLRKDGAADPMAALAEHFSGPAALEMQSALREYGIDDSLYRNLTGHIGQLANLSEADRTLLYVMQFVVVGCTGDPRQAADVVDAYSKNRIGAAFRTTVSVADDFQDSDDEGFGDDGARLGLMRIVGGKLKGADGFYHISPTEQGTVIGTLASEPGSITDVDADVSRQHARIFRKGNHYYIVGLKSTNGTTVIAGDDKMEHVVEPPKRERPRDYVPTPYEIFPTDTICLGASTRFMVMLFMD